MCCIMNIFEMKTIIASDVYIPLLFQALQSTQGNHM